MSRCESDPPLAIARCTLCAEADPFPFRNWKAGDECFFLRSVSACGLVKRLICCFPPGRNAASPLQFRALPSSMIIERIRGFASERFDAFAIAATSGRESILPLFLRLRFSIESSRQLSSSWIVGCAKSSLDAPEDARRSSIGGCGSGVIALIVVCEAWGGVATAARSWLSLALWRGTP